MIPCRGSALRLLAEGRQIGAQILTDPVDQTSRLGIGQMASFLGDFLHLVEEYLFMAPEFFCVCISRRVCLRRNGNSLDLGRLLGFEFLWRPLAAFVVSVGRRVKSTASLSLPEETLGVNRTPFLPLPLNSGAVHLQAARKSLD